MDRGGWPRISPREETVMSALVVLPGAAFILSAGCVQPVHRGHWQGKSLSRQPKRPVRKAPRVSGGLPGGSPLMMTATLGAQLSAHEFFGRRFTVRVISSTHALSLGGCQRFRGYRNAISSGYSLPFASPQHRMRTSRRPVLWAAAIPRRRTKPRHGLSSTAAGGV